MSGSVADEHIENWSSGGLRFVQVTIGEPTKLQVKALGDETGGLWLILEGPKAVGLRSTQILLPSGVSEDPVISLNHAFTKLSEIFEPWRKSHTGNVYQRFLYLEKDSRWYPLELLRNGALA